MSATPLLPDMSQVFNIYCDESCHLEHDREKVMVLGAVWCPLIARGILPSTCANSRPPTV